MHELDGRRNPNRHVPALVICPGVHPQHLSASFLQALAEGWSVVLRPADGSANEPTGNPVLPYWLLPTNCLPYDPVGIFNWLQARVSLSTPLVFLCFSAGVVGGLGTALAWQHSGGVVRGFLALDGWGVPLPSSFPVSCFPVHRLSHDHFTHWSCQVLDWAFERENFYADPPTPHLQLWQAPEQVWVQQDWGWSVLGSTSSNRADSSRLQPVLAVAVLRSLLQRYCLDPRRD